MDYEIEELNAANLTTLSDKSVSLPIDTENNVLDMSDMTEWIQEQRTKSVYLGIGMGFGLCIVHSKKTGAEFSAWLETLDLSRATAYRYMGAVKSYVRYSPATRAVVSELSGRKIQVLSRLPAQVVDGLFEDGTFEAIQTMPPKEVAAIVKQEKNILQAEGQRNDAIKAGKDLQHEGREWIRSPLSEAVREESLVDAAIITATISRLQYAANDSAFNALPNKEINLSVETLIISINGIAAHLEQLISKAPPLPDDLPEFVFSHQFSAEQVEKMGRQLESLTTGTQLAKDMRAQARNPSHIKAVK